jgi:hypothetical protein
VDIAKPAGGVRTLGIPTLVDQLIQQALHHVLSPVFEPTFSERSYGFRPGRSAGQAVKPAQAYISEGRRWVVGLDLERFFDRVNHGVLMSRVARRVHDARVLKLIRRFLEAGMMQEGLVTARTEGTPEGGPLSPLLSNIPLTDLDRELERRTLAYCRYADYCNIYVRSQAAGERVMSGIRIYLEEVLRLRVNADRDGERAAAAATQPRAVAARAWPIARSHDRGLEPAAARLHGLLPAHAESAGDRDSRRAAAAAVALPVVAAVEASGAPGAEAASAWARCRSGLAQCGQRARPLVECWGLAP